MARIAGVNIPSEKKVKIALTYVYGIGLASAQKILREAGVDLEKRVSELSHSELDRIRSIIESGKYKVERELRQEIYQNIKRL